MEPACQQKAKSEVESLRERVKVLEEQLSKLLAAQSSSSSSSNGVNTATPAAPVHVEPLPETVPMGATRIVMHQIVAPSEVDALGICFGGQVLSWIDVCAGLAAKTLAHGPCVTVSVDAVHFFRPCKLGDVVMIAAMVNRTFSSSMEVGVRVEAEEMATGLRRHCCSAYLTFVSLKAKQQAKLLQQQPPQQPAPAPQDGGPKQQQETQTQGMLQATQQQQQQQRQQQLPCVLSRVVPHTSEQQRIYAQAESRRQRRLAARQAAKDDPHKAALLKACRLRPVTHREGGPTLPPPIMLTSPQESISRRSSGSSFSRQSSSGAGDIVSPRPPLPPGSQQQQQQPERAGTDSLPTVKRQVVPGATSVYMTQSIMPHHANTLGITFGGQVLSWMEQCAYISASRLRGAHHLTASMDGVSFAASTKVGDILYIISEVTAIFGSSLEVMISVFGETPSAGKVFHCADAFATIVVVDACEGRPSPIPFELQPATEEEKLRLEGAQERRSERLLMRSALAAASSIRPSLDAARS